MPSLESDPELTENIEKQVRAEMNPERHTNEAENEEADSDDSDDDDE